MHSSCGGKRNCCCVLGMCYCAGLPPSLCLPFIHSLFVACVVCACTCMFVHWFIRFKLILVYSLYDVAVLVFNSTPFVQCSLVYITCCTCMLACPQTLKYWQRAGINICSAERGRGGGSGKNSMKPVLTVTDTHMYRIFSQLGKPDQFPQTSLSFLESYSTFQVKSPLNCPTNSWKKLP